MKNVVGFWSTDQDSVMMVLRRHAFSGELVAFIMQQKEE